MLLGFKTHGARCKDLNSPYTTGLAKRFVVGDAMYRFCCCIIACKGKMRLEWNKSRLSVPSNSPTCLSLSCLDHVIRTGSALTFLDAMMPHSRDSQGLGVPKRKVTSGSLWQKVSLATACV